MPQVLERYVAHRGRVGARVVAPCEPQATPRLGELVRGHAHDGALAPQRVEPVTRPRGHREDGGGAGRLRAVLAPRPSHVDRAAIVVFPLEAAYLAAPKAARQRDHDRRLQVAVHRVVEDGRDLVGGVDVLGLDHARLLPHRRDVVGDAVGHVAVAVRPVQDHAQHPPSTGPVAPLRGHETLHDARRDLRHHPAPKSRQNRPRELAAVSIEGRGRHRAVVHPRLRRVEVCVDHLAEPPVRPHAVEVEHRLQDALGIATRALDRLGYAPRLPGVIVDGREHAPSVPSQLLDRAAEPPHADFPSATRLESSRGDSAESKRSAVSRPFSSNER